MNSDTPIPTSENPPPTPQPSTCGTPPLTPFNFRGNGKVSRLPKSIRDQINQWMLDGVSYPDIIERLGEHGKDLKPDNLSQWKKRGHQDWLLEQAWLAQTRARQEPGVALSADFDATQLNHAALQLGTLHMFEALRDLNSPHPAYRSDSNVEGGGNGQDQGEPEPVPVPSPWGEGQGEGNGSALTPTASAPQVPPPNQKSKIKNQKSALDLRLGGDSSAFVRLMNALARASRETPSANSLKTNAGTSFSKSTKSSAFPPTTTMTPNPSPPPRSPRPPRPRHQTNRHPSPPPPNQIKNPPCSSLSLGRGPG
ncbi:MAG TPA: hypothetical protein VN578_14670 [Candidatus Binatia bacterium]|jgi:hypothetical protein|nr:hypothetical protein [Candidatus Binatia bacterium]